MNDDFQRYKHGGKRENAGRKAIGITKKVSITLPENLWDQIDQIVATDPKLNSYSKVFRKLTKNALE